MWNARVYSDTSNHKNLQPAFNNLLNLKDKLKLSNDVVDRIAYIYKKAHEKRLVHGRTISAFIAAATYGVLKEIGVSRTLDEVCEISNIKPKELMKAFKQLVFQLEFKAPPIDITKYVAKMANKANISEKTKRQAIDIIHELGKSSITAGRDPRCLAAAILYLASSMTGEKVSQIQLAKASSKSVVAIRNLVKEIKKQHFFEIKSVNHA
jgi:transcription initiation factor TFIIB